MLGASALLPASEIRTTMSMPQWVGLWQDHFLASNVRSYFREIGIVGSYNYKKYKTRGLMVNFNRGLLLSSEL